MAQIKVTIQRTNGQIDTVILDRAAVGHIATSDQLRERFIAANREAARKDSSKGGEVLSIEEIEDDYTPDAESLAWWRVLDARTALQLASEDYASRDVADTLRLGKAVEAAQLALQQAMDEYSMLPEHPHKLAEQAEQARQAAERKEQARRNAWM